jgi:hypothetical protein
MRSSPLLSLGSHARRFVVSMILCQSATLLRYVLCSCDPNGLVTRSRRVAAALVRL